MDLNRIFQNELWYPVYVLYVIVVIDEWNPLEKEDEEIFIGISEDSQINQW